MNDDDADFNPNENTSSNLSSLFGTNRRPPSGNASLMYTAPKAPRDNDRSTVSGSEPVSKSSSGQLQIIIAKTVTAHKLENGSYVNQGSAGIAIIGNYSMHIYQIILYKNKKEYMSKTHVSKNLSFSVMENNYASFYDDTGQNWSVLFSSPSEIEQFSRQVAIAKYNSESEPPNSIFVQDLLPASGATPNSGDKVKIKYTCFILRHDEISKFRAEKSSSIEIDGSEFVPWHEGLKKCHEKCKQVIIVPKSMSDPWSSELPENSSLLIDLNVESIENPVSRKSYSKDKSEDEVGQKTEENVTDSSADDRSCREKCGLKETIFLSRSHKTNLISRIAKISQGAFLSDPNELEAENCVPVRQVNRLKAVNKVAHQLHQCIPIDLHSCAQHNSDKVGSSAPQTSQNCKYEIDFTWQQQKMKSGINVACQQVCPTDCADSDKTSSNCAETELKNSINEVSDKVDNILNKLQELNSFNQESMRRHQSATVLDPDSVLNTIQNITAENDRLKSSIDQQNKRMSEQDRKIQKLMEICQGPGDFQIEKDAQKPYGTESATNQGSRQSASQDITEEMKKVMNTVNKKLQAQFESDKMYEGSEVKKTIANTIREVALGYLNYRSRQKSLAFTEESKPRSITELSEKKQSHQSDFDAETRRATHVVEQVPSTVVSQRPTAEEENSGRSRGVSGIAEPISRLTSGERERRSEGSSVRSQVGSEQVASSSRSITELSEKKQLHQSDFDAETRRATHVVEQVPSTVVSQRPTAEEENSGRSSGVSDIAEPISRLTSGERERRSEGSSERSQVGSEQVASSSRSITELSEKKQSHQSDFDAETRRATHVVEQVPSTVVSQRPTAEEENSGRSRGVSDIAEPISRLTSGERERRSEGSSERSQVGSEQAASSSRSITELSEKKQSHQSDFDAETRRATHVVEQVPSTVVSQRPTAEEENSGRSRGVSDIAEPISRLTSGERERRSEGSSERSQVGSEQVASSSNRSFEEQDVHQTAEKRESDLRDASEVTQPSLRRTLDEESISADERTPISNVSPKSGVLTSGKTSKESEYQTKDEPGLGSGVGSETENKFYGLPERGVDEKESLSGETYEGSGSSSPAATQRKAVGSSFQSTDTVVEIASELLQTQKSFASERENDSQSSSERAKITPSTTTRDLIVITRRTISVFSKVKQEDEAVREGESKAEESKSKSELTLVAVPISDLQRSIHRLPEIEITHTTESEIENILNRERQRRKEMEDEDEDEDEKSSYEDEEKSEKSQASVNRLTGSKALEIESQEDSPYKSYYQSWGSSKPPPLPPAGEDEDSDENMDEWLQ